ncbi:hypothetical protein SS1G_06685 [Sclerotinia sclerotiorum 1980 UF-70]|uniref:HpcH/HpaI aldolase/citrate lyase domain-containing protein n=1 Tax=Sclerotinia sclerotiorum (strain ATCC 18683 / 1980 / Ss-1) TaxID=665079 RepID=A7EMY6_SCLS1|nr:hypothetical protein SS1G_06685 [Sclerotinia sclerotiorum 1980 UF-70]EDO04202.1 hypothetical protein SS1G_06685 [Sclerotinia sclerotiorum 1980 UF-70]
MASIMQGANRLRRVMAEGKEPAMGCWQMIPGANVSRTLARTGVDWVLVDCEHGNIDEILPIVHGRWCVVEVPSSIRSPAVARTFMICWADVVIGTRKIYYNQVA